MFTASETGPEIQGNQIRFRICLPGIEKEQGFSVKVYVISKQGQFDVNVPANVYELNPVGDDMWGEIPKTQWQSDFLTMELGVYLYRFEISGPAKDSGKQFRSLYFGDPCAWETDAGTFSVFRIPGDAPFQWEDDDFKIPPLNETILYELNVAEFGGTFVGVADRIPYLHSLGVNVIELLPINSIAEPNRWGYMPVFYFAPEERFGGPGGLKHLVQECHRNNIAVIIDMVYAHADRMFPYQIGYERFFHLWEDNWHTDATGLHRSPNPMVSAYDNFGKKHDWRMQSTQEFFKAVNRFWLEEYHIDGFRYDHVNGYLDKKPIKKNNKIEWYSQENRPTFTSLQELSKATYHQSKNYSRFQPTQNSPSRIIQIAEDLRESSYQLSSVSASAINGNWEKRLADIAADMAKHDYLADNLGRELLLNDDRFDSQGYTGTKTIDADSIQSLVVQFIESHDESRLFHLMQYGEEGDEGGYKYRNGLDEQQWWQLQPYAIALLTSVGVPMLWAGQEFAENTGLPKSGMARVRGLRPLHWDYFYNVSSEQGEATVLPLVTLYRKLGKLRRQLPSLQGPRDNAKQEYFHQDNRVLVYRRWQDGEVVLVALNFSNSQKYISIPFGHAGTWVDVLHKSYKDQYPPYTKQVDDPAVPTRFSIPSNFGRIMCHG